MPSGFFIDWSIYDELLRSDLPNMTIVEWGKKYADHISVKAIGARARKLGVRPKRYRPTAEHVLKVAAGLKIATPEMLEQIRSLRDTMSARELARTIDISYATLFRIMSEHNIRPSRSNQVKTIDMNICSVDDQIGLAKLRNRLKSETRSTSEMSATYRRSLKYKESSVERFLSSRLASLGRNSRIDHFGNPRKTHEVTITLDYLMKLWENQGGRCKITGKNMEHKSSLFAVSIDRIESDYGYVPGNIQLVCMAINLAKNRYSNADMIHFWSSESL